MRIHFSRGLTMGTNYGPSKRPWWKSFSFAFYRLTVHKPSFGFRLWVYRHYDGYKIGQAYDLYVDRR